jgi:hypothetical protein
VGFHRRIKIKSWGVLLALSVSNNTRLLYYICIYERTSGIYLPLVAARRLETIKCYFTHSLSRLCVFLPSGDPILLSVMHCDKKISEIAPQRMGKPRWRAVLPLIEIPTPHTNFCVLNNGNVKTHHHLYSNIRINLASSSNYNL